MPSPGLSHSQHQSQSQTQSIAPQMQQGLEVLQTPTLELRKLIQQELIDNPVLEDETEEISLDEPPQDDDVPDDLEFDDEFAALSRLDDDWRDLMAQQASQAPRRDDDDERRQFLFDSLVTPITLQEHLLNQLGTSSANREEIELGKIIIGNIDDRGYLTSSPEDIAYSMGIPVEKLNAAATLIRSFHPPGVGATDLRECLLLQLDYLGKHGGLAYRIVADHLDDLARKRFPTIAKRLGISVDQVDHAADQIASLDPHPGSQFSSVQSQIVVADVVVERDGDSFVAVVDGQQVPHLRISNLYKNLMTQKGTDRDVRSYIREKIESGKMLIKHIHSRQRTIQRIADEIVRRQHAFLEGGVSHLKPLTMAQVADAVGVHETTVSRTVAGKYMRTPHGLYEMRFFFTSGYHTKSGEELSNTSVKSALGDLIKSEDPKYPLSDEVLATKLREQGIDIARRTVAKYREQLHILPSHLRKGFK